VTKTCPICSKEFECPPSHAQRRVCCSKPCYKTWMRRARAAEKPKRWTCVRCGKEFNSSGRAPKYCSRDCREKELQHNCEVCGKPFWLKASHEFLRKTCSLACAGLYRGDKAQAGGSITAQGYRLLQIRNRRILEHRKVMEDHLGRPLYKWEEIHHLDGNRLNNRLDNLELWVKRQPGGQRRDDLLPWAILFIESCGYVVSKKHEGVDVPLVVAPPPRE
jgi:hypothetical protein